MYYFHLQQADIKGSGRHNILCIYHVWLKMQAKSTIQIEQSCSYSNEMKQIKFLGHCAFHIHSFKYLPILQSNLSLRRPVFKDHIPSSLVRAHNHIPFYAWWLRVAIRALKNSASEYTVYGELLS